MKRFLVAVETLVAQHAPPGSRRARLPHRVGKGGVRAPEIALRFSIKGLKNIGNEKQAIGKSVYLVHLVNLIVMVDLNLKGRDAQEMQDWLTT